MFPRHISCRLYAVFYGNAAAILCLFYLDLLWNIFHQFLSMTNNAHQFIGTRKTCQTVHCIIHGFAVQSSKAFIHKQCIHLNTSQI